MSKLNELTNVVYEILSTKPETRGDDYLLILEVFKSYDVADDGVEYVFHNHSVIGLPSLESITRCRRKIQCNHPELVGDAMRKIRREEEKKFKKFALNID